MAKKRKKKLTKTETQWIAFAYEWIQHFNGEKAAIAAGYSKRSAVTTASRLLTYGKVQDIIAQAMKERLERLKIDADLVLKRLAAEADAKLSEIYNENGSIKQVHEWPDIWQQGLISGLETRILAEGDDNSISITKIRISDRIKRLELIGRHIDVQAFKNRVENEIPGLKEVMESINGTSRGLPSGEKPGD
jgi:phage terminase small subunit